MAYDLESVKKDLNAISDIALIGVGETEELGSLKLRPTDIGEDVDLRDSLGEIRSLTESAIHTLTHMAQGEEKP